MGKGADLENGAPSFRFGKSRYTVVSLFLAAKRKNGRQAKVCVHFLVDFFYRVGPNKQTGVHSIELTKRHRRTETTQSRVGGWGGEVHAGHTQRCRGKPTVGAICLQCGVGVKEVDTR